MDQSVFIVIQHNVLFFDLVIANDECWELVDVIPPPVPQIYYPSAASGNYSYFKVLELHLINSIIGCIISFIQTLVDTYTSFACHHLSEIQLECLEEGYMLGWYRKIPE